MNIFFTKIQHFAKYLGGSVDHDYYGCRGKSDIILNRVIRIRECNKGKNNIDGEKIYVEHNGWKVTNLPLLSLLTDLDDYVDLKYISKV